MSTARPRQYLSLQAGRAVAALLVLLYHAGHFAADTTRWNRPDIFRHLAGPSLGVEAFFVLSGIVILTAHRRDLDHPSSVPLYLWKRFRRIYPIYWVVLALTLLLQVLGHEPLFAAQRTPLPILSAVLLVHIRPEGIVPVSWTLHHELMFYVIFAAALVNRWLGGLLLGAWFVMSVLHISGDTGALSFFSPLHLLFAMGMLGAWLLRRWDSTPLPVLLLVLGSLLFWSDVVCAGYFNLPSWTPLTAGFGALLIFLGAAELEAQGRLRVAPWIVFLGDASYSIYLIHFGVMSKLSGLCFRLNAHLHLPILFWMLVFLGGGTAAGCLLHVWLERPLLKWLSRPRDPALPVVTTVAPV